jgi:transcriptional antiterminator RfaH
MWIGSTEEAPDGARTGRVKPSECRWYVAQTLPHKEELASRNLARQNFQSFLPRYRATRRHARKRYDVLAPLFPGYIFIRFDPDNAPWRSINGTQGIRRLVGPQLTRPLPMPASAIDNLMARCRNGIMLSLFDGLEPGTISRVTSGPFANQLVTIEAHEADERVRVLLNILGSDRTIEVSLDCLGPT